MNEEHHLNESYIDIDELKKALNVSEFARSLLPELDKFIDTDETLFEEFLDDIGKKLKNNEVNSITSDDFKSLYTWTHVKFKKKSIPLPRVDLQIDDNFEKKETEIVQNGSKEDQSRNRNFLIQDFLQDEYNAKNQLGDLKINTKDIPAIDESDEKSFRFYYLDAYNKYFGEQTTAYLFGKTYCHHSQSYKTCCVAVNPLKRRILVVPRAFFVQENKENAWAIAVFKEVYMMALKPSNIKTFNFRIIKKKNFEDAFTADEQLMLEIEYSADFPVLNTKLEGATFSKILGVKNDCLENFLLDKKIKGPCWLDVSNPKKAFIKKTWCSVELSCSTNDVSLCESTDELPNPPLTLLSFHMRCTDQTKAIVLISWAVLSNYNIWNEDSNVADDQINCTFTYVNSETEELSELKGLKRTRIEKMKSEKDMLTYFLRKFNETDPDLVVGYDIHNKEFHTFLNRLESLRIEDRNKLSKFKRAPKNLDSKKFVFNGRIVCDLRHLAKSFDLSRNYELNELLSKFLGVRDEQRWVVDFRELISPTGTFTNIAELKEKFLETFVVATKEPLFLLKLALKTDVIPLAFKLTEISGNILWQTFTLGITKKCENLIVHALNEENFVVPSKMLRDKSKTENQLIGGLVLEPNVGYYDNYVLLMDFQSLYPSIIHEYNLCITHDVFPDSDSRFRPVGVLPNLMKNLINKRKLIKDEMNRNHANNRYRHNIYQSSIKLLSNGIYGSLAAPFFRFYSPTMAQEITKQARKILTETVDLLKGQGYEIIYGDTDSLMINTNSTNLDFARETGEKIRGIVNSEYSSINLKIDAVFKKLMIVTKKKYAGNVVDLENGTEEIVLKGLDIVRYDCPVYVNQVGQKIVDLILSELSLQEKHEKIKFKLQTIKKQLLNDEVPKEKLVITKYLTQDLNSCLQDVPHVQLAKRLNQTSSFKFNNGDAVSFIMCSDKNKTFSQKPFHITELTLMKNLEIDGHYYINIQIYPFVSKICRLIGLEYEQIEEYLGVNATKSEEVKIEGGFDRRDPFIFDCLKCGRKNVLEENGDVLDKCSNPDCDSRPLDNPSYLQNRLVINLRCYVQKYYKYELECSECSHRTSRLTFKYKNCPKCGKETLSQVFNEVDLFLQIQYFKYIFQNALVAATQERKEILELLLGIIKGYEKRSGFLSVNLTRLFRNS